MDGDGSNQYKNRSSSDYFGILWVWDAAMGCATRDEENG